MIKDHTKGLDNFASSSFQPLGKLGAERGIKPSLNELAAIPAGPLPKIADFLAAAKGSASSSSGASAGCVA